jgi:HTH-type transcriptional regulator, sugar sensing transcriptional regulator
LIREHIIKVLEDFGVKKIGAEVYVFLEKNGSKQVKELAYSLEVTKGQLYRILKRLQDQNMVKVNTERPATFSAVPLEVILDLIIKTKIEQAQKVNSTKELFKIN